MALIDYARERVQALLKEIRKLKAAEFPYENPRRALEALEIRFEGHVARLARLDERSSVEVVQSECAVSLDEAMRFLPLLGFVLRATNVRNAFEVLGPLSRLTQQVLGVVPGRSDLARLVLSSEWEYSPLTYGEIPNFPGFLLIGLPATESANALLVPLAGHEIGHALAERAGLEREFRQQISASILAQIKRRMDEFRAVFQRANVNESDLDSDLFLRELWAPASAWALKQVEETFCDCVGVRLFGAAYLYAFAYLMAPGRSIERAPRYPTLAARVANLTGAMKEFAYETPPGFGEVFTSPGGRRFMTDIERFNVSLADGALSAVGPGVATWARTLLADIPAPSVAETQRILSRFRLMVPAEQPKTLADIVNAGWLAHENPELWRDTKFFEKRFDILRELVLKNVELLEIEGVMAERKDAEK